ncbi:4Fe-4S binding protein [Chloroflexota bacterium]
MPIINVKKCNGCGLCLSVCSCGALALVDNLITVIPTIDCGWCTLCEAVCATGAIICPFEIVFEEN